jgi:hypothetical protein
MLDQAASVVPQLPGVAIKSDDGAIASFQQIDTVAAGRAADGPKQRMGTAGQRARFPAD